MSAGKWRQTPAEQEMLNGWGYQVWLMFDAMPYQVGSSLEARLGMIDREPRDVDIRVLLDEERWADLGDPTFLRYLHVAVSLWGRQITGLPIDFQVQCAKAANEEFGGRPRAAIGIDPRLRADALVQRERNKRQAEP